MENRESKKVNSNPLDCLEPNSIIEVKFEQGLNINASKGILKFD